MSAFKDWLTGLTSKTTPVDADELYLRDSSGTPSSKKLTWANLKSAISSVPLGEIRYFADAPTDPAWMKCDGASYLRASYPNYESLRPKAALKLTVLHEQSALYTGPYGGICWTGQYFIACAVDPTRYSYSRNLYRSVDAIDWTLLPDVLPVDMDMSLVFSFGGTGRVLAMGITTGECVVSLDHGATWSTGSPTQMPTTTTPLLSSNGNWTYPLMMSTGQIVSFFSSGDIAAISADGVSWTKIQLPFAGIWETVHDKYPPDSDVWAADSSTPGRYVGVYNNTFYGSGFWLPCVGMFNDWRGGNSAYGPSHYVSMSKNQKQLLVADTGGSYIHRQVLYDVPADLGKLSGVAYLDGRFIGRSSSDLLVFTAETDSMEYIKDFFLGEPLDSARDMAVSKDGVVYLVGGGLNSKVYSISTEPLKFNAPGLSPIGGTTPYVYTGA